MIGDSRQNARDCRNNPGHGSRRCDRCNRKIRKNPQGPLLPLSILTIRRKCRRPSVCRYGPLLPDDDCARRTAMPPHDEAPSSTHAPTRVVVSERRRRSSETPWTRRIRVARIRCGRFAHSLSMSLRHLLPGTAGANRMAFFKRACGAAVQNANSHRKLAAVGGCLLLAAVVLTWKERPAAPARPAAEAPAVVLDKVKVFPPPESRDLPSSDSADRPPMGTEPGRFPPVTAHRSAGPEFPAENDATGAKPVAATPRTPRAVWLSGTIEDVEQPAPRIQSTGHVERPFRPRPAPGLMVAPSARNRRR